MQLFLQILGVLFLVLIVGIVALWLLVRYKLRSALESLGKMGAGQPPARIHLEEADDFEWKDPAAVRRMEAALREAGFQPAGAYQAEEVPGLYLCALAHPEQAVYAAVYEHPEAGAWLDLVSYYQDGTSVTYTTTTQGAGLDQRPGHGVTRDPGADPIALLRRLLAERPTRPLAPASPEQFQAVFEKAYADGMDWRNSRGGPTEEEVRAILAESGTEASDEEIEQTREALAQQALYSLDEALLERFKEQTTMSVSRWEEIEDRLVFVHDRLTPEMVLERFNEWLEDEEGEAAAVPPEAPTPRAGFALLNESLPADCRFEKIAEMREPLPTDVYAAPE
jgi:hypothetical protein